MFLFFSFLDNVFLFQIVGFILLVIGMAVYNNVFAALIERLPRWRRNRDVGHGDTEALISQPADEPEPLISSGPRSDS
jgi:hypothetical protein